MAGNKHRVPPLTIELMLMCHYRADPYNGFPSSVWQSKSMDEARAWLVDNDLVTEDRLRPTARGAVWVSGICSVPLPEANWKIPGMEHV